MFINKKHCFKKKGKNSTFYAWVTYDGLDHYRTYNKGVFFSNIISNDSIRSTSIKYQEKYFGVITWGSNYLEVDFTYIPLNRIPLCRCGTMI